MAQMFSDLNFTGDDEIPKLDLVADFNPDNPRTQTDPLIAALSIGMQQMPGGIEGMQHLMMQFMKATESGNWSEENIDPRDIEKMMFDPDDRTAARISSLMETRYEEVYDKECRLKAEKMRELKKQTSLPDDNGNNSNAQKEPNK